MQAGSLSLDSHLVISTITLSHLDIRHVYTVIGKVTKVALEKMPLMDEPLYRIAVDLIGPIFSMSYNDNLNILIGDWLRDAMTRGYCTD